MSVTFSRLWVHAFWSVKDRAKAINKNISGIIAEIMKREFEQMNCFVKDMAILDDHVHFLFSMPPEIAVSAVLKQVKGCTSHEINSRVLLPDKFAWQKGFYALSVSEVSVMRVGEYLRKQKEYHQSHSFDAEIGEMQQLIVNMTD